jgi:hypothetical protein
MTLRKIPLKNYIKFGIIVLTSLITCFILFIIYNNFKNDSSVLTNKVSEIDYLDIDNYINENESVLFYFGVVQDENSKKIEEQMLEMIEEKDLDFVYVNLSKLDNKKGFLKKFSKEYSDSKIIDNYPAFVYLKDGNIVDVIQKEDRYLEIDDVERFVESNDIKGEKNA